jgi:hypothetical protein
MANGTGERQRTDMWPYSVSPLAACHLLSVSVVFVALPSIETPQFQGQVLPLRESEWPK